MILRGENSIEIVSKQGRNHSFRLKIQATDAQSETDSREWSLKKRVIPKTSHHSRRKQDRDDVVNETLKTKVRTEESLKDHTIDSQHRVISIIDDLHEATKGVVQPFGVPEATSKVDSSALLIEIQQLETLDLKGVFQNPETQNQSFSQLFPNCDTCQNQQADPRHEEVHLSSFDQQNLKITPQPTSNFGAKPKRLSLTDSVVLI